MGACVSTEKVVWVRCSPANQHPGRAIMLPLIPGQRLAGMLEQVRRDYGLTYQHIYQSDNQGNVDFQQELRAADPVVMHMANNDMDHPIWFTATNDALVESIRRVVR